tara:strand:- start:145 stop:1053 length:909 start_codon:yes stop_codon:yes gene_type:complete
MNHLNILITGSDGFIGKHICRTIIKLHPEFNIFGVGRNKDVYSADYKYISCDLLNIEDIKKLPNKIDIIIHLAGDARSFIDPLENSSQEVSNFIMTSNISDYAIKIGVKLIIFASSVYVYSGNLAPFSEKNIPAPIENLGKSKLKAENLLKSIAFAGYYKSISLRLFTVYGLGSNERQFIPQAIKKINSSNSTLTFHSADIIRDFIYIDDVVKAFISSIKQIDFNFTYEVFNIGTGTGTSIREIISLLLNKLNSKKEIKFTKNTINIDSNHVANIDYARKILNWKPNIRLNDGLEKIISFSS